MKWKIKRADRGHDRRSRDHRTRRVFAWHKTAVGDYWVWLQFYYVEERFFMLAGGGPGYWSVVRTYLPSKSSA